MKTLTTYFLAACAGLGLLMFFTGCTPTVQLAAPKEAVKIDVDMKVEVVTRKEGGEPVVVRSGPDEPGNGDTPAAESRRNRVSEYQELLSRGVAGINHKGLLEMRPLGPQDTDKDYIVSVIDAENRDRMSILKAQALKEGKSLDRVQLELYDRLRQSVMKSKSPIWIETRNGNQGEWVWQKLP
ncbi:DUF1318 domain-containing protein [Kamptonema cortianum]|nr:DUF1318 domain-containing protein [Oscillatoria laete-virens]MDK3158023.1 DUF1318 domain-containing protein [Kamptonema cortianum]MDL5048208.1 DUF1318 domain-containing protein [Oscillatoria amoena NRMC-F 0135]MDL5053101.1 DUF1318 domain-containing protein [Oscillatoria laete-virens NRMC-F 0139]